MEKNVFQETNKHSHMTELVVCFMDKLTGKKFFVSPQSYNPVLLRVWNVCYRMKTSIRNIGHHKALAFFMGLTLSPVCSPRWKGFVVCHSRKVLKFLFNNLKCVWNEIFYGMDLKYFELKLLFLNRFRKKIHLCLFRKKKYIWTVAYKLSYLL